MAAPLFLLHRPSLGTTGVGGATHINQMNIGVCMPAHLFVCVKQAGCYFN